MDLYLQFGHGMKELTLELSKRWNGSNVILSPRDMTPKQLPVWSKEFEQAGANCFFDPQCYCPKGDPKNLVQYDYWEPNLNTNLQTGASIIDQQIKDIKRYNDIAKTKAYIIPCILNSYEHGWAERFVLQCKRYILSARTYMKDKPLWITLALPKDFLVQREETIEPVLQAILDFDVDGYYVIAESVDRKYLVDNPLWLSNVLHICATLKLAGKTVIYGYGNHQLLPLSLIRADAMASGSWLNVRSFTNRFIDLDHQRRRKTWVYYPEALSEYKLDFLDFAFNNGYLYSMWSDDKRFLDPSVDKLLHANVLPSQTDFKERDAFKHYLSCLKHQIEILEKPTYQEAYESYQILLTTAAMEIERLENIGIYAQTRSFRDYIDINRAAVNRLDKNHGFALKMSWKTL